MTSASAPPPPDVGKELGRAINALDSHSGNLISAESKIAPALSRLNTADNLQNISQLSQSFFQSGAPTTFAQGESQGNDYFRNQAGVLENSVGKVAGSLDSANPYTSTLESAATGSNFLGAGTDSGLNTLAMIQANYGSSINPTLSDISSSSTTGGDIFSRLMGSSAALPGEADLASQLSAPTLGLVKTTQQQLALGGSISPQEEDMVSQASRAADSARGIFDSRASSSNELLNLDQFSQARLAARESAASNAAGLANNELQQNVVNRQNALTGASSIFNTGNQTALNATSTEGALNLQGFQQAAATRASALGDQLSRSSTGLNQLAYLAGLGQNNTSSALNFINANSGLSALNQATGVYGNILGGMQGAPANPNPTVFNSLGLFPAAHDNSNTAYNAQFAANEQNAQAQNGMMGAGIAAGASLLSIGAIAL